ncbi:MAG: hypothetical protein P8Y67_07840 [Alphaproteobacteria bacterium]
MKKTTIASIAALTLLAGTSIAAFASNDRYEHRSNSSDDVQKVKTCQDDSKNCRDEKGSYRNHERNEHRYGDNNERGKHNGRRYDD